MKRTLSILFLGLFLAACVDTTGLSAESSKVPHPQTNANAAVVVQEYGDLQCPACRAAYLQLIKPLVQQYGSQMSLEFHQFPLVSLHPYAMVAAEASECAADQGKFWDFVDMDYENQDKLNNDELDVWGKQLGLDMDLYDRCRKSHIKRDTIKAEYDEGDQKGVNGTPTFFVNGTQVAATIQDLGAAIQAAAANAGKNL